MGQGLPCRVAPAGGEVGCRVVQPSPVQWGPVARPCPSSPPALLGFRLRHLLAVTAGLGGGAAGLPQPPHPPPPCSRLFEYRGRVSPVPRVVPVKRPRVTIPLVRRVKATLPVKLFARSAAIANSSAKLKREYACRMAQSLVCTWTPYPREFTHGARCSPGKTYTNQNIWKQRPKQGPLGSPQAASAAGDGAHTT